MWMPSIVRIPAQRARVIGGAVRGLAHALRPSSFRPTGPWAPPMDKRTRTEFHRVARARVFIFWTIAALGGAVVALTGPLDWPWITSYNAAAVAFFATTQALRYAVAAWQLRNLAIGPHGGKWTILSFARRGGLIPPKNWRA